jgi:ACS family glucarate transporter-like MFS transporter
LGIIGFVWALIWYFWFRNDPEQHKGIGDEEKEYILSTRQQVAPEEVEKLSVGLLLRSKNMWLAMGQYFASNFTFFFSLTWLFPHIKTEYNLDAVEAGFYASAPLIFGALGNYFFRVSGR